MISKTSWQPKGKSGCTRFFPGKENSLRQSTARLHLQTSQQANAFSLAGNLFCWLNLDFREVDQQDMRKRAAHREIFHRPICTGKEQDVCWLAGPEEGLAHWEVQSWQEMSADHVQSPREDFGAPPGRCWTNTWLPNILDSTENQPALGKSGQNKA